MLPPSEISAAQIEDAIALARRWQRRATELQTPEERRQQAELDGMLHEPAAKATLIQMTDQAFRTASPRRTVDQFTHILDVQGIPRFFSLVDRSLLRGFQTFGSWLPQLSVPLVKRHLLHETARVVLPAEQTLLREHLREQQAAGLRMNVNFLGEALLGEEEARRRLRGYLEALQLPELEVLSVKISTLYSQISPIARAHTVRVLCDRLEPLFREAARLRYTRPDGTEVPKFLYLDMEEYRDMSLTAEAFMGTLDRPGLEQARAGIALQAYLPDAFSTQQSITAWARERVARGGAPVTLRIVKGANLEMERVDASLHGWPQAPFTHKRETDANYLRMLREALLTENLAAVHVGVASHNLFTLALACTLAGPSRGGGRVHFEMLEGMATHQRRAILAEARDLLLYAPACRHDEFLHAIGYLVRRLDENTGPDNFLSHAFRLEPDSPEWRYLEEEFRASLQTHPASAPRRTQDRNLPPPEVPDDAPFVNEPDTDFALEQNSRWAETLVAEWRLRPAAEISLVIDGSEVRPVGSKTESHDPSEPARIIARHSTAEWPEIDRALACAERDEDGWRNLPAAERSRVLAGVAASLRAGRSALLGAALANTGKTIAEGDPEVSEAIDFVEYYRRSAESFHALPTVSAQGVGVAVVVPPWNFPIAIPCGGIAAALAAGNTVILKPATPSVLVAWELCQCFWRAGVSRRVLQFLPCSGAENASRLVCDPRVKAVILTGGTATALHLLRQRPDLPLSAETGGKNAMIVTALSDREQAVKHAVHSAFAHGGQKCSATSLLLLEAEVYDDPHFRDLLIDAARSCQTGSAWDLPTRLGPLIHPPRGDLERALTTLEPGETWALQPGPLADNPHLRTPGIKYGVQPGSYTHLTEFFGPVLGVMRFETLDEAIDLVHQTGYGLTSGLQSLDDREHAHWRSRLRAGNLYLNKPTVGAIVHRQPFGGMGKSAVGPALKAGGPNYLAQFFHFTEKPAADPLSRARESYDLAWREEFSREHDDCHLLGEDNIRRYLPIEQLRIRLDPRDTPFEIAARLHAAALVGATVSRFPGQAVLIDTSLPIIEESDVALAEAIDQGLVQRVRYAAPDRVPSVVRQSAARAGIYLADRPVLTEGRIELLWYLHEQSISFAWHRYGNLSARSAHPNSHAE